MYYLVGLITLNKLPDDMRGITDYYETVLNKHSSQYKVCKLWVGEDKYNSFHMYIELDIPEGKKKNIAPELEAYYSKILNEASSQFGGARIFVIGGKSD